MLMDSHLNRADQILLEIFVRDVAIKILKKKVREIKITI